MSVDVFGRQLTSRSVNKHFGGGGSRGPPGNGFKMTVDGQYDIDKRRLCNIADPIEQNDAISAQVMQNFVQQELRVNYQMMSSLQNTVDSHDIMIHSLQSKLEDKMKQQLIAFDTLQELVTHNSQLIVHLEDRLRTLKKLSTNDENNKLMIQSLQITVNEQFKRLDVESKTDKALALRNSKVIAGLDTRLGALENGEGKGSTRG